MFDLDGTLVDSLRDIADSANAVLAACGAAPLSESAIAGMVGEGAALLIARAFAAANCQRPPDLLERFLQAYNERLLRFTRPYPGIPALLDTLSARGTLAVLTNKPVGATRTILEGCRLSTHFDDRVLGGDGPFPRKPDPSGLLSLVERVGTSPGRTLMIGDSYVDLQTARNAGTRACVARYGFGFPGIPTGALQDDDRIIDHPLDLATAL